MSLVWWVSLACVAALSTAIAWSKPRADIAKLIGLALGACAIVVGIDLLSGVDLLDFSARNRNWKLYLLLAITVGWIVALFASFVGDTKKGEVGK